MEQVERCNLCGGADFVLFAEKYGPATNRMFRIVACRACGLRFVSPRLTADENRALYDEAYFNGKGFDSSVNYVKLEAAAEVRRDENAGILAKIALLRPGLGIRILDVGCGTGCLLKALERAGYRDVWGIEFSEYAAEVARREARGAKVLVGDVLEADLPKASFDVINATEVIEHLRDPLAFFARVKTLLAPGGVFIYSTGNAKGLYARVLGTRWPYLHPEGHLFYYDPSTLARYFAKVGLQAVDPASLASTDRRTLLRAEDRIAHSQLLYIGQDDRSLKGHVLRAVGALDSPLVRRAVTWVVGKHRLPIAANPAV